MGYRIYGSPWQPLYRSWAFGKPHGPALAEVWGSIPVDVDILMTHGPPQGVCDRCKTGRHVGCEDLYRAIVERAVPISLFGHIHEAYGIEVHGPTTYINASTCTVGLHPHNAPVVFDLRPADECRASANADADSMCPVCEGTGLLLQAVCPLCDCVS
mmetsp:Transcript_5148/g.10468  ORF Transcript_5148/g.10468 Transcript_5148/m.10468 type:complete len:157 (+) Transcript_5148:123-593(+)